jgi:hypothetical protein
MPCKNIKHQLGERFFFFFADYISMGKTVWWSIEKCALICVSD